MYRILLVDDEKMELEALKNYIDWKTLGIDHVDTAKNGKAAYELVLDRQPDIVITDIQMPVMDGIDLAKKIYEWNRDIKIIFLTGYDDFAYIKEAFQVNAVNYILKPFSEESIAEVIHRAIKQIEKENLFQNSVDVMGKLLLQRLCTEEQTPEDRLLQELKQVSGKKKRRSFRYGSVFSGFSEEPGPEYGEKTGRDRNSLAGWQYADFFNLGLCGFSRCGFSDPEDSERTYRKKLWRCLVEAQCGERRPPGGLASAEELGKRDFL